ncbi:MAG: serine hydrolase [Acidobacteria bacterium]|nr:serine hydrolase [Acidobacteriota bacterium]
MFPATALAALMLFPAAGADLRFPSGNQWTRVTPAQAGWNAAALDAALHYAGSHKANAVVVLHRGRILAEKQWGNPAPEDVASVQKSVVAVLCGIAKEKKLIRLEDVVSDHLGAGWSKESREQERDITLRHLLTMTSGTTDSLEYQAEAGARWRYNSVAYQKLLPALAKASGKSANDLTMEWLTGPLGMTRSQWRDRPGTGGMVGFVTTAHDLARFGLLVLAEGNWAGKQIVPAAWIREMLRPSQQLNPAYGYLWWLNGQHVLRANGQKAGTRIPAAPKDLVAALGARHRKVYVVPSLELVVTKTGPDEAEFDNGFWTELMKAAPGK